MKELEILNKEQLEVIANQSKQVEHQLIGFLVPHNGHKIWEINVVTREVNEAKFANTTYNAFSVNRKEIIMNKDCVYVCALNKKNAVLKAMKGSAGGKKVNQNPLQLIR